MSPSPFHTRSDVVQVHAAIGFFVTSFSDLILGMRRQMTRFVVNDSSQFFSREPLVDILFDRMTAEPLVSAYFAMTSEIGLLDDKDREVRKALRALVQYYVEMRNTIVHADWDVGWEEESGEPVPTTARKIKTSGNGVRLEYFDADHAAINLAAGRLNYLARITRIYGDVCHRRRNGDETTRVSDVLETYRTPEPVGRAVRERKVAT